MALAAPGGKPCPRLARQARLACRPRQRSASRTQWSDSIDSGDESADRAVRSL